MGAHPELAHLKRHRGGFVLGLYLKGMLGDCQVCPALTVSSAKQAKQESQKQKILQLAMSNGKWLEP